MAVCTDPGKECGLEGEFSLVTSGICVEMTDRKECC